MKILCWLILFTSMNANARVFTETFNTTTQQVSSTLVWNFELGYLHPKLKIYNYRNSTQAVASQTTFSVSDGSHGPFELSTYSQFGTIVGNHITIDANQFPILKLTRFNLDSAYTLSSINGPLIIHSLSTVNIDGVIECSGKDGSAAVGATGGAGGIGRCAGFTGGNGGNAATSGTIGASLSGTSMSGGGGIFTGAVSGAGGGGGASYTDNDGSPGVSAGGNTGGSAGLRKAGLDHNFDILSGSGGGGGGSGSSTQGGGGGGAGGGTVIIRAVGNVTISLTGAVLANGGNGGAANSGGGGGGGAGGNISIFTPTNIHCASGNVITTYAGVGGTPDFTFPGNGGNASDGRIWDMAGNSNFTGGIGEAQASTLLIDGIVGFVSGTTEVAISKSYDTESTLATYTSITANPASSDITFDIAGSDDNFVNDDSGWINSAAISAIAKKRYVKYRVNMTNTDDTNPTIVDDVYIGFDPGTKENFEFKSGGCGLVKNIPPQNMQWLISILLLVPLILAWQLRKPKTVQAPVKK